MSFNHYYQSELSALREQGREFARRNPALAPYLASSSSDPMASTSLAGIINLRDPAPLKKPLQPKWAHAAAYDSWSPMSNHVPV